MGYICTHAKKYKDFPFFICELLEKGNVPRNAAEAAKCFCKHQEYCYLTGNPKNTEKARICEVGT